MRWVVRVIIIIMIIRNLCGTIMPWHKVIRKRYLTSLLSDFGLLFSSLFYFIL